MPLFQSTPRTGTIIYCLFYKRQQMVCLSSHPSQSAGTQNSAHSAWINVLKHHLKIDKVSQSVSGCVNVPQAIDPRGDRNSILQRCLLR